MPYSNLKNFVEPDSIAIIGASRDKSKVGNIILHNILSNKYKGRLYVINPFARKVLGIKSYESILDITDNIDLAIIAVPAKFVLEVLAECGQKSIKNVVIITAGFSEIGDDGLQLQYDLEKLAKKFDINILGPNCLGFINTKINLDATFGSATPLRGNIAFASQSGAMGTSFIDWARKQNLGLSHFFSFGNKIGINENDLLEYFYNDDQVKLIVLYLEDFINGKEFMKLATKINQTKPIIILKPGKSVASQKAISSHTGAIATDSKIIETALRQSGCIQVNTMEELFYIARLFAWQPIIKNNKVAVITNAGGVGIQTVDDLENAGLEITLLSKSTQNDLNKYLPTEASTTNPVDLLGDARADRYKLSLEKVIKDKNVDSIVVLLTPQRVTESLLTAKYVNQIADSYNKCVVSCFIGGEIVEKSIQFLAKEKIPNYLFPNDATRSLGLMWDWVIRQSKLNNNIHKDITYVNNTLHSESSDEMLPTLVSQSLFAKYNIPLLITSGTDDLQKAKQIAQNIGYPLVAKINHPRLIHKTEFNAVKLNIENEVQLEESFEELSNTAKSNKLINFTIELQPYIKDKIELIIGVKKDNNTVININGNNIVRSYGFGHTIIVGSGGIYAEVYQDIAMRVLPINDVQAHDMLLETKVSQILDGARGKSYNLDAVINLLVNLSKLITYNTNITAIDINPLFVTKDKVYVADLKIFV
jgi:acetate---CoA ligase (ADP-forming)